MRLREFLEKAEGMLFKGAAEHPVVIVLNGIVYDPKEFSFDGKVTRIICKSGGNNGDKQEGGQTNKTIPSNPTVAAVSTTPSVPDSPPRSVEIRSEQLEGDRGGSPAQPRTNPPHKAPSTPIHPLKKPGKT